MPTYQQYLAYASEKRFIPLTEGAFNALIKARFNPITSSFERK